MRGSPQPSLQEIENLSRLAPGYPVSRDELLWAARDAKLSDETTKLVGLFSQEQVFRTPDEVVEALRSLSKLIGPTKTTPSS